MQFVKESSCIVFQAVCLQTRSFTIRFRFQIYADSYWTAISFQSGPQDNVLPGKKKTNNKKPSFSRPAAVNARKLDGQWPKRRVRAAVSVPATAKDADFRRFSMKTKAEKGDRRWARIVGEVFENRQRNRTARANFQKNCAGSSL